MSRIVVAIDGLAASGKSSIAKMLANKLGYVHLNTGLFYRAATFLASNAKIPASEVKALIELLNQHKFELVLNPENSSGILIDGHLAGKELHTDAVSTRVSEYSAVKELRQFFFKHQREAFPGRNLVAEGRDMGTVVFPDASAKFFVVADLDVRARRRLRQLNELETEERLAKMKSEIQRRDKIDTERQVAPTVRAQESQEIDNSSKQLEVIVSEIAERVNSQILASAVRK